MAFSKGMMVNMHCHVSGALTAVIMQWVTAEVAEDASICHNANMCWLLQAFWNPTTTQQCCSSISLAPQKAPILLMSFQPTGESSRQRCARVSHP